MSECNRQNVRTLISNYKDKKYINNKRKNRVFLGGEEKMDQLDEKNCKKAKFQGKRIRLKKSKKYT